MTGAPKDEPRAAGTGAPDLPAGVALFLDFDGTLVHHEDHPAAVRIDAPLRTLMEGLREATGGALALISGRAIADLDALFSPDRFAIAGQHGAERRSADGTMHFHASPAERLQGTAAELRRFVAAHPGLLLEEKGSSLALHYRNAPALAGPAEREARRALAALGDEFELQGGKFVFEVRPSGRDKGTAVSEFLAEAPFAGRVPVFVGDDLTDELGFEIVNGRGGHTVKVGAGPTRARWRLADADAVRRWLSDFATRGGRGT
ncbi:MAG: trehalose-phosphatase [Burkholderiales bacterium]